MHTHCDRKTYVIIQESGGQGHKQGGGEDGGEGMGRRMQSEVDTHGEGKDHKRIEVMGDRIGWREI